MAWTVSMAILNRINSLIKKSQWTTKNNVLLKPMISIQFFNELLIIIIIMKMKFIANNAIVLFRIQKIMNLILLKKNL